MIIIIIVLGNNSHKFDLFVISFWYNGKGDVNSFGVLVFTFKKFVK